MALFEHYFVLIMLAAIVGGMIGLEREYHDKTAGLRTMILIAIGSALFTIFSKEIGGAADPARVASSIVTGVGFLGAGAIIKVGMNVRGLTTAASIWLVASLGMGIGAGHITLTFTVTLLVLVILWCLPYFEHKIDKFHEFLEFDITIYNSEECERYLFDIFKEEHIRYVSLNRSKLNEHERQIRVMAKNNPQKHARLSQRLAAAEFVHRFNS